MATRESVTTDHINQTMYFAVGYRKAGTTSMHGFFNKVGILSIHHDRNGGLGRRMEENQRDGLPLFTGYHERYRAFTNAEYYDQNGYYLGFKQYRDALETYPNMKFILNTRNRDRWLRSVSHHINRSWDNNEPYLLGEFGSNSLDVWLEGIAQDWDNHHRDVVAAIPSDRLLVFNIEDDDPRILCKFLGLSDDKAVHWKHMHRTGGTLTRVVEDILYRKPPKPIRLFIRHQLPKWGFKPGRVRSLFSRLDVVEHRRRSRAKRVANNSAAESKPPRVAMVTGTPQVECIGGVARVVKEIANGLAERDVDVTLFVEQDDAFWGDTRPGVRVIPTSKSRNRRSVNWRLLLMVLWFVRCKHPDVVVASSTRGLICAGLVSLLFPHLNLMVRYDNVPPRDSGEIMGRRKRRLEWLHRFLLPRVGTHITVSDDLAVTIEKTLPKGNHKIVSMLNPHDIDGIVKKSMEPVDHPWLTENRDRAIPVILTVARIAEAKDIDTMLRAVSEILSRRPVYLIVVGDGPEVKRLKMLTTQLGIAHHVDFIGYRDNPYPYFTNADVYALSSRHEGLPGTLIEALATGIPIVSTDCPTGPREILRDGQLGRLVPVGDHVALAEGLIAALDDRKDDTAAAAAADERRLASRKYDQERIMDAYFDLLVGEHR